MPVPVRDQLAFDAALTRAVLRVFLRTVFGWQTPSLHTLGRLAGTLAIPVGTFFDQAPNGRLHVGRRKEYAVVSFDGSTKRWEVLAAGLFRGKVRAVVSSLGRRGKSVPPGAPASPAHPGRGSQPPSRGHQDARRPTPEKDA